MKIKRTFWMICLLSTLSSFGQEEWQKVREKQGITIYTRIVEGKVFKAFKGTMEVAGNLDAFLSVLYDVNSLPDWGYKIKKAELLRREGDSVQVYYAVARSPFPFRDRDGVYENRFDWDPESNTLWVAIDLIQGQVDESEDLVRLKGSGYWKVRPLDEQKLMVTFEMQMDPGGNIPPWLANLFAADTPYYTLTGLRDLLIQDRYQRKTHALLR